MKRKIFLIAFFSIIVFSILLMQYNNEKMKRNDITNAAEQYLTTGFFNSHKLYKIESYYLSFSDQNNAILQVKGLQNASPHKTVAYKLIMIKDKNGLWKVKSLEELDLNNFTNLNEEN